ncbi:Cytochrome P450 2G1 [Bulinus truncatus]|nr:Cytochrome P450 2G1 [Bulinus truncatus]
MIDLVLIFVIVLCITFWRTTLRHKDMPPGPSLTLPLIGHLHLLESDPTQQFIKWRKRLGDVFTVQFGYKKVVFLCGHDAIHEALVKQHHNFMNRTDSFIHTIMFNNRGVISLAGDEWKEHRSFLQQTLKDLDLGRNVMAERIHKEIEFLLQELNDSKGKPMQLRHLLSASVCNVIALVTFGRRRDYKDDNFMKMQQLTIRAFEMASPSNPVHFFHRLIRFLPGNLFYYRELVDYVNAMRENIASLIDETVCDGGVENISVVSAYREEMDKRRRNGQVCTSMSEENLVYSCWNFFKAGTETSSTTILYGILYLVVHPDIQEKLFQEIKEHVGTDHPPPWDCKQRLVQLNAFILETQRLSSIIPLRLDRNTEKDTRILNISSAEHFFNRTFLQPNISSTEHFLN